jgi:hypothetical protein
MKDIRRLASLQVWRRLFGISKPSEWGYIGTNIQGWLGNGGGVNAVPEYGEEV